jgi:protoheme IX farnesyltransferase
MKSKNTRWASPIQKVTEYLRGTTLSSLVLNMPSLLKVGLADDMIATVVPSLLSDYATLFKLRISTMVIITAGAGFYLGCLHSGTSPFRFDGFAALLGVAVVTCGASALNQALERRTDRLMHRTAERPMATGRISMIHGLSLGLAATLAGSLFLAWTTNLLTGGLTLLTAIGYVFVYTPLKRIHRLNTFVGAFPGALPPLIGWAAARGRIEWPGVALFAILFIWQFPHFMAIGWMYREDYGRGGIRLASTLPDINEAARSTTVQAVTYAVLMVPVSLVPAALQTTGHLYVLAALLLDVGYLWCSIRFVNILRDPLSVASRRYARDLLRVSVIYLPLLLAAMMLDAKGRLIL